MIGKFYATPVWSKPMPTLIRLLVVLIFLAGLAFGGMVALTILVDPAPKEVRQRVPAGDLGVTPPTNDPLGLRTPPPVIDPGPAPAPAGDAAE